MATARITENTKIAVATCVMFTCCPLWANQRNEHKVSDEACDIAPFGFRVSDIDGGWHGIRWAEPRKVRRMIVQFEDDQTLPDPCEVKLQYWHRT